MTDRPENTSVAGGTPPPASPKARLRELVAGRPFAAFVALAYLWSWASLLENSVMLSKRSIVTVADGDKAALFPDFGEEIDLRLAALPRLDVANDASGGGHRRCSGGLVRMRVFSVWAATVAAGIAWSAFPTRADDAQVAAGHALVQMYCTDCHATEPVGDSPFPTAPRFRDLHLRYDVEVLGEALVEGIVTAHPEMPQFEFDPDQAQAIIEYLKSLEPADWRAARSKNDEH